MTPKEKAEELIKKCFSVKFEDGEEKYFANLIADEVIAALDYPDSLDNADHANYWDKVKIAINE